MTKLSVPDMSCGHCKAAIEKAIHALEPGAGVQVNLEDRTVEVTSGIAEDALLAALMSEGFPAEVQA